MADTIYMSDENLKIFEKNRNLLIDDRKKIMTAARNIRSIADTGEVQLLKKEYSAIKPLLENIEKVAGIIIKVNGYWEGINRDARIYAKSTPNYANIMGK